MKTKKQIYQYGKNMKKTSPYFFIIIAFAVNNRIMSYQEYAFNTDKYINLLSHKSLVWD